MIFLFLTNYAEYNDKLAVMAINSFVRDCSNKDFKIRGLALRALCSLKFKGAVDYIQPQVLQMLNDFDAYVRKTAINGCVKLHYLDSSFTECIFYIKKQQIILLILFMIC